jgi:acid phosphatase family membrane protein YuiD
VRLSPSRRKWRVLIVPVSGHARALAEILRERLVSDGLQVEVGRGPASGSSLVLACCVVLVTTSVTATQTGLEACVFAIIAVSESTAFGPACPSELQALAAQVAERIRRLR